MIQDHAQGTRAMTWDVDAAVSAPERLPADTIRSAVKATVPRVRVVHGAGRTAVSVCFPVQARLRYAAHHRAVEVLATDVLPLLPGGELVDLQVSERSSPAL